MERGGNCFLCLNASYATGTACLPCDSIIYIEYLEFDTEIYHSKATWVVLAVVNWQFG